MDSQFVVEWQDGKVTVVKSKDRDTFIRDVLEKNLDKIVRAEHDHRIQFTPPAKTESDEDSGGTIEASAAPVNWGVSITQADFVWPHAKGSGITVAVIDSGLETSNAQFQGQLHINPGEFGKTPGVDDDGNGLIDDISGWDFPGNTGNVTEVLVGDSHGTHVAGIIAAAHSGSDKVMGMAPEAKILPLNFMDATRGGSIGDALAAIDYAVAQGAKVINASWGSSGCSSILESKVAELTGKNVLFVAAAGNSGVDIGFAPEFPAAYQFNHQITVGASGPNDFRAFFSNFSGALVNLLAPGSEIFSTIANDDFQPFKSGTSMAAPFVSGAAAVLWSSKPSATPLEIKSVILNSVDFSHSSGSGDTTSGGRLNLRKAYNLLHGTSI